MQKIPSSLAVLAEIFLALSEIFQKEFAVFQGYQCEAEDIVTVLTNSTWRAW